MKNSYYKSLRRVHAPVIEQSNRQKQQWSGAVSANKHPPRVYKHTVRLTSLPWTRDGRSRKTGQHPNVLSQKGSLGTASHLVETVLSTLHALLPPSGRICDIEEPSHPIYISSGTCLGTIYWRWADRFSSPPLPLPVDFI